MLEIGKQINLEAEGLIAYIVDGVDDDSSNKIILRGARTLDDLKCKFEEYERIRNSADKTKKIMGAKPKQYVSTNKPIIVIRCFNCGARGHEAKMCPDVDKGPKCFQCREYGHLSRNCTVKKPVTNKVNAVFTNEMCIDVVIGNIKTKALIDTGSEVNLITENLYKEFCNVRTINTNRIFVGFGGASVTSQVRIEQNIEIQGEIYKLIFYVIPDNTMTVKVILGSEIAKQAEIKIRRDEITVQKLRAIGDEGNETKEFPMIVGCVQNENELDSGIICE